MNNHRAPVSSDSSLSPTQVISKLMALWYRTIGHEHHKDRDCHFTIETRFSYGGQVRFILSHLGYVDKDIEEEYWSYELAEQALIRHLGQRIRKFCSHCSAIDQDVEDAHIDQCHEILDELGDLQILIAEKP